MEESSGQILLNLLYSEYLTNGTTSIGKREFTAQVRLFFPHLRTSTTTLEQQRVTVVHGIRWRIGSDVDKQHNLHHLKDTKYLFISKHIRNGNRVTFEIELGNQITVELFGCKLNIKKLGLSDYSSLEVIEKTLSHINICRGYPGGEDKWKTDGVEDEMKFSCATSCKHVVYGHRKDSIMCISCSKAILKLKHEEEKGDELGELKAKLDTILPESQSNMIVDIVTNANCNSKSQRRWESR